MQYSTLTKQDILELVVIFIGILIICIIPYLVGLIVGKEIDCPACKVGKLAFQGSYYICSNCDYVTPQNFNDAY